MTRKGALNTSMTIYLLSQHMYYVQTSYFGTECMRGLILFLLVISYSQCKAVISWCLEQLLEIQSTIQIILIKLD